MECADQQTCPTLWRVYVYRSEKSQQRELENREDSSSWEREAVGGDSHDEWCYNCGGSGHFGDVSSHFTTSHRIEAPYDSILINHVTS